ncbi:hypothetical protein RHABOEDO_001499 [Candidatus Rhabdochlamydia oedothoracis]|uniref:Uncharacterized protein n=1 Tax=Candidatus Rhabdochlamydia oedothoracis TaxID=2720720 RepID=A0ABX8V1Z0_9BACT|nr:hypothetical protein RHABOEDO_001499 [Candidatus Rhabdochlamydia oedothoracis]
MGFERGLMSITASKSQLLFVFAYFFGFSPTKILAAFPNVLFYF